MSYDPIDKAREMFLDLENPRPDLLAIAAELDVKPHDVYRASIKGNWLYLRRLAESKATTSIVPADAAGALEAAVDNDVAAVRKALFIADVELVQTRERVLIDYLDELLAGGHLGAREAVQYLKVLDKISERIQATIDKQVKDLKDDDVQVREWLSSIRAKADAIRTVRKGKPVDPDALRSRRDHFKEMMKKRGAPSDPQES